MTEKELTVYKKKYAKLIAVVGINDCKGKVCKVQADLDDPEIVTYIVDELYNRGARRVEVTWLYRPVFRTVYKHTSKEELMNVYSPELARFKFEADEKVPLVVLESESPYWMEGIDPVKVADVKKAHLKARAPYRDKMRMVETPWCLAAVPGKEWAKVLFPKLSEKEALMKMWEKVIICCRLKGDPIKNWQKYNKDIKARAKWLDSLHIKTLHYTSKNGTDLIVGVHKDVTFCGGAHDSLGNPPYNPNMPAVECFTTPDRLVTEGIVYSTKPLSRDGQLMKDFSIRFHKGRIVEVKAKKGEQLLKRLINTEDASHYLGELALVPYNSEVSNTKMIYYNTLFDENAACHLAFGSSIEATYKPHLRKLSKEQLIKRGVNCSNIHIDFMVGNKDLNIVATTRDGKKVQIFKNGNWAKKL